MNDKELDNMLGDFDYSLMSNVRESLLTDLLNRRKQDRMSSNEIGVASLLRRKQLSLDELDYVAAAGKLPQHEEMLPVKGKNPANS